MVKEVVGMQLTNLRGTNCAIMELSRYPVPGTVRVFDEDVEIFPYSIDDNGILMFTVEQYEVLRADKALDMKADWRYSDTQFVSLEFIVEYEELKIDEAQRPEFDTDKGILESTTDLRSFTTMLDNRKKYISYYPHRKLNEFLIWGRYRLDEIGEVYNVLPEGVEPPKNFRVVQASNNDTNGDSVKLPRYGDTCPICSKPFQINDLINANFIEYEVVSSQVFHVSCFRTYISSFMFNKIVSGVIDKVHNSWDQAVVEEIPREQLESRYHFWKDVPFWYKVTTRRGDILVGPLDYHYIFIEWQKNFVSFDPKEIFDNDSSFKCQADGRRSVEASSAEEAIIYLQAVHDYVEKNMHRQAVPDYFKQ